MITTELELQHKILPVQAEQYACIGCTIPPFISDTSSVYSMNELYPKQIFGNGILGIFDNCKLISIPFTPFQYNPVKGKLVITLSVEFTLRLKQMANPNDFRALKKLERYKDMNKTFILGMVENKSDYELYSLPVTTLQSIDHSNSTVDFFEYAIISSSTFKNKALRLIDWKRKKGLDAGFVDIADVLSAYSGVGDNIGNVLYTNSNTIYDDTAKVRMYLKDAFEQHGTQWVLIVGDEDVVPVRYQYMSSDDFNATDTYYGNFTGDWNVNGDNKYGENGGDKVIGNLELYVGRIPCNSPIEFENWIIKSLLYEQDPGKGSSEYLSRCIGMQGDHLQNSNDYGFFMDATNGFYSHHVFEEQISSSASGSSLTAPLGADIISYVNNSPPNLWFWFEHGLYNTVQTMSNGLNMGMVSQISTVETIEPGASLNNLNNFDQPGIVYAGSCLVAAFQKEKSGNSKCLAEYYLTNNLAGGIAFMGATNEITINNWFLQYFSSNFPLLNSHRDYITHLGSFYSLIKNKFRTQFPGYASQYFAHNLFGDPETRFFTHVPVRIKASIKPRHIVVNTATNIVLSLFNINKNDTVYASVYGSGYNGGIPKVFVIKGNDGVTNYTMNGIFVTCTQPLYLTISGFNYLPYTNEIVVAPTCTKSNTTEEIATTPAQPWFGTVFKDRDVLIRLGATLTITGDVYFVVGAKMIVEPGAKLIIDGGSLNAGCEGLWQGVEVRGQSGLTQYSNVNQGFIQVKNNGSINDAICAIATAQPSGLNYVAGTSGGIFTCTDARFSNNLRCVHVYPYQYGNYNYNSNLSKCEFLLNDNYIPGRYPQNTAMIWYDHIKGIGNSGLTFINTMTEDDVTYRGNGILATNAGFGLNQICDSPNNTVPCDQYRKPYFEGLYYGIKCSNTGTPKNVLIGNCNFVNNTRGIYLSAVTNPSVTQCAFKTIANMVEKQETNSSGIYLDACTGYSVQENTFEGHYPGTNTYETGIVINNSGATPNEIYNNTFTKLQNGILAQNKNRDATGQNGLVIKCNDFFSPNKYDIAVTKDTIGILGIKTMQGTNGQLTPDPASNTFSYTHQNSESDYHNECENITYIYHAVANGANINPVNHTPIPVVDPIPSQFSVSYIKTASCPSKLDNGGGGISQLKLQQDGTETVISNYTGQMLSLKDGGNTAELKEDIAYSIPPEALALYNLLIAKSPYLSDTVLIEAIGKEDVLPSVMVTDVLVANPQSAKSSEVNDALDNRTNLLSDDQRDDVDQGVFVLSAFESLQSKLGDALAQRAQIQYAIANHYLIDTTGTDSLKIYLTAQPDLWAKQMLLMQFISESDTTAADALLQTIEINNLNALQQAEWNDLTEFYDLNWQLSANANHTPDSLQQIALTELGAHNTHAAAYARNLLINQGMIVYNEPYIFPDDNLKSGKVIRRKQVTNRSNVDFKVYPNPAKDYVIIEYTGERKDKFSSTEIIDAIGQIILKRKFEESSNLLIIPITGLAPGAYTIRIVKDSGTYSESKLIILH